METLRQSSRNWSYYPRTYRHEAMATVSGWIRRGKSSVVIGLPGCGKSNFLGFLCNRPDAMNHYLGERPLKTFCISVDLNNLVNYKLATFYRSLLRSIYFSRANLPADFSQLVATIYLDNRAEQDVFVVQSSIFELLFDCKSKGYRLVFVFDRFDDFCERSNWQLTDTLRGLRDGFKDTLIYVMGMRRSVLFMPNKSALGELYEILDQHICWLSYMNDSDARLIASRETVFAPQLPTNKDIVQILKCAGRYPALVRAIIDWYLNRNGDIPPYKAWLTLLLQEQSVQYRIEEILSGLSQEERFTLIKAERLAPQLMESKEDIGILNGLEKRGLCWQVKQARYSFNPLILSYLQTGRLTGLGKIQKDARSGEIYQGQTLITPKLTPLEGSVLDFFLEKPHIRHTKSYIIANAWPSDIDKQGVTDESLYQVVSGLRKKIEPGVKPSYILNWRGWPEGGYQFYPEGLPA